MSAPASVPPPRLPGLARTDPERLALRIRIAAWLRAWCRAHDVSRRDLVAMWGLSRHVVDEVWTGQRPLPGECIARLPARHRAQVAIEYVSLINAA